MVLKYTEKGLVCPENMYMPRISTDNSKRIRMVNS